MRNETRTVQRPAAGPFAEWQQEPYDGPEVSAEFTRQSDTNAVSTRMEGSVKNILVPMDFSPSSWLALAKALPLARQCRAAVTLLYVMDLNLYTPPVGPAHADKLKAQLEREGRERLSQAVQMLKDEPFEVNTLIQEGLPYQQICDAALKADLIVIGKSKPKPFWHLFSRRTVEAVLDSAPCPVLVVREDQNNGKIPQYVSL